MSIRKGLKDEIRQEVDRRIAEAMRSKPRPKRIGIQVIKVERINESW